MRRDLQEHHQLPSVNNLILALGKFLSIPVLNRLCTSILTSNAAVLKYSQNWVQNITDTLWPSSGFLHVNGYAHGPFFIVLLLLRLLEIWHCTNKSEKKKWKIYCFEFVSSQNNFFHPNLSYGRTHHLSPAALWLSPVGLNLVCHDRNNIKIYYLHLLFAF